MLTGQNERPLGVYSGHTALFDAANNLVSVCKPLIRAQIDYILFGKSIASIFYWTYNSPLFGLQLFFYNRYGYER